MFEAFRAIQYRKPRSAWGLEFLENFTYADGLVNTVATANWLEDTTNAMTIASGQMASPAAGVVRTQANHTLANPSPDMRKAYQIRARFGGGSDFGGGTEILVENAVNDDQSGNRLFIAYTTAGGAIQFDLFQTITNRGTAVNATLSPIIRGGVAGNNFGIAFDVAILIGANDSDGVGFRTCRVYCNEQLVISTAGTFNNSPNTNKRVGIGMNWGPTQLFKWDWFRFSGNP